MALILTKCESYLKILVTRSDKIIISFDLIIVI